jgi:signal transduction histidine kinase
VRWEIQPLPKVDCDRGLMKQVFANLLGNAAKFTRGRKPAVIQIGTLPEKPEDHEVVVFVKDNGAGFDHNRANALFEPFRRLHRYSEFEGSGIGLANVKRIILKHGGRVWAEGEINSGATFYFSLPRQPVVEQGGGASLASSVGATC